MKPRASSGAGAAVRAYACKRLGRAYMAVFFKGTLLDSAAQWMAEHLPNMIEPQRTAPARTYRVSDSLGSLLETYILDGIDDGDSRELFRARCAVVAGWNRATDRLVVDAADARDLMAALDWALDSMADEKPHLVGTGRIVVSLHRSGMALMNGLLRQLANAREMAP